MAKTYIKLAGAAMAAIMLLGVPVSAAKVITGDSFTKNSASDWETDRYEPEEWDTSQNELFLSIGKSGYRGNRPANKQDKYYAYQGRKLQVERPESNTWTATVRMNVTSDWFTTSSNRRRAEFRVDLVDASGTPLADSPAIALVNGGGEITSLKYYNPKAVGKWGNASYFLNGDKEKEDVSVTEGWHTLYIKCVNGVITYYFDSMKLGNCTITEKDIYPSFMALNGYNYESPYAIVFDNAYLYDGAVSPAKLISSDKQDEVDERKASQYAKRRSDWVDRYTSNGVLTKPIPDSYWKY